MSKSRRSGRAAWAALALLVGAAPGCSGPSGWTYEKPRATPAQIDHDMTACRKVAPSHSPFRIFQEEKVDRDAYNRCMKSRGYDVKPPS